MRARPSPQGGSAIATGVSPWKAMGTHAQPPQGAAETIGGARTVASAAPCGGWEGGNAAFHGLTPVAIELPPPAGAGPA